MPINKHDYALVVGIDHYPDHVDLDGAINDAEEFAAWLIDKRIGGGLPKKNCKLVVSKKKSRRPIHEDIDDKLDEIFEAVKDIEARRLYLFFGGHGLARSNVDTDLCLAKWSYARRNLALDSQGYLKLMMGSGHFTEVAFFLDCCRMRVPSAVGRGPARGLATPGAIACHSRQFVASATEFQNRAFEAYVADTLGIDTSVVRGHFTRALMSALRGAAADSCGGVRASRLKEYLEINTPRIAQEAGHQQIPEVLNGFSSALGNEPVFGSALPPEVAMGSAASGLGPIEVKFTFSKGLIGPIVLFGPDGEEIKRDDPTTGPWHICLMPRLHVLIDEKSKAEKSLHLYSDLSLVEGVFHVHF